MAIKLPFKLPEVKIDLFKNPKPAGDLAQELIVLAEREIKGKGRGGEKLEAVADALNKAIDIPLLPEAAEAVVFRALAQLVYGLVREKLSELADRG